MCRLKFALQNQEHGSNSTINSIDGTEKTQYFA
jgi:hypothetical protein